MWRSGDVALPSLAKPGQNPAATHRLKRLLAHLAGSLRSLRYTKLIVVITPAPMKSQISPPTIAGPMGMPWALMLMVSVAMRIVPDPLCDEKSHRTLAWDEAGVTHRQNLPVARIEPRCRLKQLSGVPIKRPIGGELTIWVAAGTGQGSASSSARPACRSVCVVSTSHLQVMGHSASVCRDVTVSTVTPRYDQTIAVASGEPLVADTHRPGQVRIAIPLRGEATGWSGCAAVGGS